ncbi:MAG: sigma 54-interacting transcriptional regulator [Gemmatimonadota bacterium]|nr:sigma 54-interacting transcriptional regulator [Gemmatimonadota bacterium]
MPPSPTPTRRRNLSALIREAPVSDCLAVVLPWLRDDFQRTRITGLRSRFPHHALIVVTNKDADNVRHLRAVVVDELIWLPDLAREFVPAARRACAHTTRQMIANAIDAANALAPRLREALRVAAMRATPVRTLRQLAAVARCDRTTLWYHWHRDVDRALNLRPQDYLFLDELGELVLASQAKLLRALEAGAVTMLGDTKPRPVDIRLIAATNRPLDQLVADGRFRADLLYRLQVITVRLPSLRERREDVEPLAVHFIASLATRHHVAARPLSEAARRAMWSYDWPGNVRELRNALESALVLADGAAIELEDLPVNITGSALPLRPVDGAITGLSFAAAHARASTDFDRAFLVAALERDGGNISRTARALGMHRQTLQKLLRRLGMP